jgi:ATP-dependent DNA ligase
MFWGGKFVGDENFGYRRSLLVKHIGKNVPQDFKFNESLIKHGRKEKWEGFILRKRAGKIVYTMNGKAKRTGSWKWKYEETDDFIVVDAEYGKGKHDKYFARFKLAQYDKNGELIDCGYCGPGTLKITELEEIYKNRKAVGGVYKIKPYMVIEVAYRVRTKDGKLEFPVFQRIRDDKKDEECVYDR